MVDGALRSQFAYGPDRQRVWQHAVGSDGSTTTRYVGGLLEKVTPSSGAEEWRHYVPTPSGTIVVRRWAGGSATRYLLTDHLGSTDAVLDEQGDPVVAESFDAWGKRRSGASWVGAPSLADKQAIANTSRDGYTGHEMLDTVGLVHMRGRVYDPTLGRFLSVDPLIGDLADSQQVNPYAYVGNRPMGWTDPTGLAAADVASAPLCGPAAPVCGFIIDSFVMFVSSRVFGLGDRRPPPPPAIAIPGISTQSGIGLCGLGSTSRSCSGSGVPAGATPGFNPQAFGPAAVDGGVALPTGLSSSPSIGRSLIAAILGSAAGTGAASRSSDRARSDVSDSDIRVYVTYVLTKTGTGEVYVGRTSGFGTPEQLVRARFQRHYVLRAEGFEVSAYSVDESAIGEVGRVAIRGREQQLFDHYVEAQGRANVRNVIRPVYRCNISGVQYHEAASAQFGELHTFTGVADPLMNRGMCLP